MNTETGELGQQRLAHREKAEQFYGDLKGEGLKVRVGMEASGHARWFERLLNDLQFELWIGERSGGAHETDSKAEDGSPGCRALDNYIATWDES